MGKEVSECALTDLEQWDRDFKGYVPEVVEKVGFHEIYSKYLRPDSSKTVLEVGCAGGRHLCYLTKKFGYRPYGIDYSKVGLERTRQTFEVNQLPTPMLFESDFFSWRPEMKFDLVMSHGFVEHFTNFREVVTRHTDLVEDGGLLIISMPHMAHLNHLFRWLVDRETLKYHNLNIMNLRAVRRAFTGLPFEILHLNYHRTFAFPPPRAGLKLWQKFAYFIIYRSGRRIRKLVGRNRPNFLISPKIICVARRFPGNEQVAAEHVDSQALKFVNTSSLKEVSSPD